MESKKPGYLDLAINSLLILGLAILMIEMIAQSKDMEKRIEGLESEVKELKEWRRESRRYNR